MFKNIIINKLKQYGQSLLHNNVKHDINTAYYTAQGLVDKLPTVRKTFAKNALDFLRNSIFEVTKIKGQSNKKKKVIDAEFEVKSKK